MKLIAVADLHGNLPQDIPECDLLIIAGDICPHFDHKPGSKKDRLGQAGWFTTDFEPWLDEQPAQEVVWLWGNHDFMGTGAYKYLGLRHNHLEDSETALCDLRIYGTPYTPRYFDWAFMETEEKLAERFAHIPEGLDILISHGPSLWACDRAAGNKGDHIGSKALYERISTMQRPPKLLICGHIHGGKGEGFVFGEHGSVHVWNVAGVDEAYIPHQPMWTEIKFISDKEESANGVSI